MRGIVVPEREEDFAAGLEREDFAAEFENEMADAELAESFADTVDGETFANGGKIVAVASGAEAGLMDLLEEAWIKGSAGSILEFAGEGDDAGQIGSGGLAIVVAAEIGVRSPLAEDLFPVLDLGGDLVTE